jgi:hypothetical protein
MSVQNRSVTVAPDAPVAVGRARQGTVTSTLAGWWEALVARLLAPVDNSSIVTFRVFFGLLMFWEINRYFQKGWIEAFYVDPPFHFTYHGFGWVQPWPGWGMQAHFLLLGILALCVMVGFWYRIAAPLFFLGFTYVFLLEKAHYLNHLYLACLISFLMIFVPAHQAFSVDAQRNPEIRSRTAPTWALVLLATQVGVVYFYGGLAKLNWDWLHGEPMRLWMSEETEFLLLGRWFTEEWMVYAVSYGGLLFDLLIVPALLWPRTRWFAVAALVLFHRFNAEMFSIGIFPMFATLSVVLFLPPDLPRNIVNRLRGTKPAKASHGKARRADRDVAEVTAGRMPFSERTVAQRVTVILVLAYLGFQLLIPFRHWLYPGNTAWTDQGDRFAWRMMLVSKRGDITFVVTYPPTGQTWEINPDDYLTNMQLSQMQTQPDMILQFSHFLARQWEKDGYADVEVRANSSITLNGRDPYPIVDPTVNLAAEHLSPLNADWITSIEEMERQAQQTSSSEDGDG